MLLQLLLTPKAIPFLVLADTFFSIHFDSVIRSMTFLPCFCHCAGQISYPFDFINWNNLVEFYSNGRPADAIFRQVEAKKLRYMICIILRQTHFLKVLPMHNMMSHTLKGLITVSFQSIYSHYLEPCRQALLLAKSYQTDKFCCLNAQIH